MKEHLKQGQRKESFIKQLDFFAQNIYLLNTNLYLLRKILNFPFQLLGKNGDDNLFFLMVEKNLFEYSVLVVRRVLFDPSKNSWTIKKFKNEIMKELDDDEQKRTLRHRFKSFNNKKLKKLEEKVNVLRNEFYAHLSISESSEEFWRLNLGELEYLIRSINSYYDILTSLIGVDYQKTPFPYFENSETIQIHNKGQSDIEKILDDIAKQSEILQLAENDPEWWASHRTRWVKNKTERHNLKIINELRIRLLGLPEIR